MKYKNYRLTSETGSSVSTELMFEIASARVSGIELIRFELPKNDEKRAGKLRAAVLRILRMMKGRGQIQFFATEDAFSSSTTEAQFLLNKYPELTEEFSAVDAEAHRIYVKL